MMQCFIIIPTDKAINGAYYLNEVCFNGIAAIDMN